MHEKMLILFLSKLDKTVISQVKICFFNIFIHVGLISIVTIFGFLFICVPA
jgi:hypothetical protein